jgi:hypothetical protein
MITRIQLTVSLLSFPGIFSHLIFYLQRETSMTFSGNSFGFKTSLFLLFQFGDCSKITHVAAALVTIITPQFGIVGRFFRV